MTPQQAKKDLVKRFEAMKVFQGLHYKKITAKSTSFMDLAREQAIFVSVHKPVWVDTMKNAFNSINDEKGKGYILLTQ